MDAFYERLGEGRYRSTALTRGPWDPNLQHAGPPSALLARGLESIAGSTAGQVARITLDIVRPVPITELEVSAEVVRPGRNVQLLAGELRAGGEVVMRATAWRIRTDDVGVMTHPPAEQPPGPETAATPSEFPWSTGDTGYFQAIDWRFVRGGFLQPGPATVWMRLVADIVAGERPSPLGRVLAAADSGNGVSSVLNVREHFFINTDLTVALHRLPAADWVCLDAATTIQPNGIGQAHSRIFDEAGPLGHGVQTLFVAPR